MKILSTLTEIDQYIDDKLLEFFRRGKLIPLIGAGFTRNATTRYGIVPDGDKTQKLMKDLIIATDPEYKEAETLKEFDEVASLFYGVVDKEKISEFIHDNFTKVRLDDVKSDFVKLHWPFIFTLNIDDAIENHNHYQKVLPNNRIERKYITTNTLFKLHGDAYEEVVYIKNQPGLIFSREQYLQSLVNNASLMSIFYEDYSKNNILLIGCSLRNELDIEFLISQDHLQDNVSSDKIYVTTEEPSKLSGLNWRNLELIYV